MSEINSITDKFNLTRFRLNDKLHDSYADLQSQLGDQLNGLLSQRAVGQLIDCFSGQLSGRLVSQLFDYLTVDYLTIDRRLLTR